MKPRLGIGQRLGSINDLFKTDTTSNILRGRRDVLNDLNNLAPIPRQSVNMVISESFRNLGRLHVTTSTEDSSSSIFRDVCCEIERP